MFGKSHITEYNEKQKFVIVKCRMCKNDFPVFNVTKEQLEAWYAGALIQNVMRELTKDQRELFISGTCPRCWNELFDGES
jgi:ribosomal protein S27E